MFTDFYKKIVIPARGYYDSNSSNCPGYFWNTSQAEQQTILNGARDIYGNLLVSCVRPTGGTPQRTCNFYTTQNIDGTTIGKLCCPATVSYYYDKDNNQWGYSSSGLTNYFSFAFSSANIPYKASGIGTPNGYGPPIAPLYSDALMPVSFPTGSDYGLAASDFIMIGTGNTANTSSTYKLEAPVSAADCNFSIARTINGYNITIVNKKNTDLTISELGYCICVGYSTRSYYSDGSDTAGAIKSSDIPTFWNAFHNTNTFTVQGLDNAGWNRNFGSSYSIQNVCIYPVLCCRTVLPNSITIPAGERITITWNFELDM